MFFLVCEGLSNHDVAVARGTVFREVRPGGGFKTTASLTTATCDGFIGGQ